MKKLLIYLRDYKKETILGPLFKLLEASFELMVPLVIAAMIDKGIAYGDKAYILKMCVVLILLCFVGFLSAVTAQYFAAKAAAGFAKKAKRALFENIQKLSYSDMDKLGTSADKRYESGAARCQYDYKTSFEVAFCSIWCDGYGVHN